MCCQILPTCHSFAHSSITQLLNNLACCTLHTDTTHFNQFTYSPVKIINKIDTPQYNISAQKVIIILNTGQYEHVKGVHKHQRTPTAVKHLALHTMRKDGFITRVRLKSQLIQSYLLQRSYMGNNGVWILLIMKEQSKKDNIKETGD